MEGQEIIKTWQGRDVAQGPYMVQSQRPQVQDMHTELEQLLHFK